MELSSASDAKALARDLFARMHPGEAIWFDLCWDVLAQGIEPGNIPNVQPEALAAIGAADPGTLAMAKEVAIFFDAFMQEFPAVRDQLVVRLEASCKRPSRPTTEETTASRKYRTRLTADQCSTIAKR